MKPGLFASTLLSGVVMTACGETGLSDAPARAPLEQQAETLFDTTLSAIRTSIDSKIEQGVDVPVPLDAGGGYTHEQHKANGKTIYEAGMLFQQTGETKYRDFAVAVLQDYAELYPTLDLHPKVKPSTPSRLFWQGLNEAVWLVYVIQGYEAVRDDISADDRADIEDNLIRPMADFLSEGSPQTFDRIHNHGTWAAAAVGMTGYVLGDTEYSQKALYGLDKSGDAGFLKQVEQLFSPDGYYNEGPYYQRYALMPFVLFAQAIEENQPELGIFDYRDGVLKKAIYSTVQQSYAGRFFPINDAIREKGLNTAELRYAMAIAYDLTGDPTLLDVVSYQNGVVPTPEGKALSEAIANGAAKPFVFESFSLRDGSEGDRGALIALRSGPDRDDGTLVFKPTAQGLGHGHFDRLGILYYDNGHEIVADYGAARFLNVEPKFGGRYLPENTSWAKQTVAHNTLVVDETSQFGGDWRVGETISPELLAFEDTPGASFAAASLSSAYEGVQLNRTVAMVNDKDGDHFVIDLVQAQSDLTHSYDLPIHFKGQLIETNLPFDYATNGLLPLGTDNGYQHLWKVGETSQSVTSAAASIVVDDKFYTMHFATDQDMSAFLSRLGANDPNNNLRAEQAIILRTEADDASFLTVYEGHGRYDNDEEVTVYNGGSVEALTLDAVDNKGVYTIALASGRTVYLMTAPEPEKDQEHNVQHDGRELSWRGPVGLLIVDETQE